MAIINKSQMAPISQWGKIESERLKASVLSQLGYPVVNVEITEDQFEKILRYTGDFISTYMPLEERYAFFYTTPLEPEYSLPSDAYWIADILWDPSVTSITNIFSIDYITLNAANITGYQNLISDYHMILDFQKFSKRVLGIEGQWEFKVSTNKIRLFPVPKGTFPVVVKYIPIVTEFKSPQARELIHRAIKARMKEALGHARRKMGNVPGPDGGTLGFDGDQLVQEAAKEMLEAEKDARDWGEPMRPYYF